MLEGQRFYRCKKCGNIIGFIKNSGVPMFCCGEEMSVLTANTADAAQEKHLPVIAREGNLVKVSVSSVPHPMLPEHYIEWVYLLTTEGGHRKTLEPGKEAELVFALTEGEQPVAAFEYCNLHGLWKTDVTA